MKRFIINIFITLLVSAALYPVFVFILGIIPGIWAPNLRYPLGHSYNKWKDIKNYENIDIMILGSSNVNRGFDTRIFSEHGIKAFNLGSSSQSPVQSQLLLNRYLNKLNPKLVVFAFTPGFFYNDGIESAIDIITNDDNDIYTFKMAAKLNHLKVYNVLIYDTIREFLKLNSNLDFPVRTRQEGLDTYITGGFTEKATDIHFNGKGHLFDEREFKTSDFQLKVFDEILSDLKNKNIEYIMIILPQSSGERYSDLTEFYNLMNKYENIYDVHNMLNLDDKYFYDPGHLRQEGAEILSLKTIEIINTFGIINN